jgi:hypothetical protein
LKKIWERIELKENDIDVNFNTPTHFMAMREQQLLDIKYNNFNNFSLNESVSKSYCQRHYLKWPDDQMAENREWLRNDAAFQWELEQIRTGGPNFRNQQGLISQAAQDITGGGGGGSSLPAAGSTPEQPPEFGPGPATPPADTGGESAAKTPAGSPAPMPGTSS